MASYIDVIDHSFDTSIELNIEGAVKRDEERSSVGNANEDDNSFGSSSQSQNQSAYYKDGESSITSKDSSGSIATIKSLSRKLSKRLFRDSKNSSVTNLPKYCPPSEEMLFAFNLFSNAYNTQPEDKRTIPKKPKLPKVKTNTQLSTYVHKLYIYEQYLKKELRKPDLSKQRYGRHNSSANEIAPLKYYYGESAGRAVSTKILSANGRIATI